MSGTTMNEAWLREMFASIDAKNWAGLAGFLHPETVYERPGYEPLVGRDRVMRFYRVERVIQRGTHHLDGTVVEGGRAAAWGRIDAVHADGSPIDLGFADVYAFQDGVVRTRRSHFFVPAV